MDSPEGILPLPEEIDFLRKEACRMVPGFADLPAYASWAAARPLAGSRKAPGEGGAPQDGRALSRDFQVLDHELADKLPGMATIIGGKATVLRAMAEKAADVVCAKLGVKAECVTTRYRLPSWRTFHTAGGRR